MSQKVSISSNSIYALKVLSMIGVVLIHSRYVTGHRDCGMAIMDYVSGGLCSIAVPCFYFISGMLFFKGLEGNICRKLKSRFYTLFIPYVCWNIIGAVCFIVKQHFFGDAFPQYADIEITPLSLIKGFWSLSAMGVADVPYPYDYVLWFLRNLMVITPISALIYKVFKTQAWLLLLLFLAYYSCEFIDDEYRLVESLCYFYAGGIIQQYIEIEAYPANTMGDKRLITLIVMEIAIFMAWCLFTTMYPDLVPNFMTYPIYICTILCLISLFNILMGNKDIHDSIYVKSLFFVYVAHGLWSSIARSINLHIFHPDGSLGFILVYIANFLVLWYVDLLLYMLLLKISPKLANILSGSRNALR